MSPRLPLALPDQQARNVPLLLDPGPALEARGVGGGIVAREGTYLNHLPHQGRLASLPGAGQHLEKPAPFLEAGQQGLKHRPAIHAPLRCASWAARHNHDEQWGTDYSES